MSEPSAAIVSKVWNYAHVLKNAGVGYGDYVEQLTYLLFLKLADEMTDLGFDNTIPSEHGCPELNRKMAAAFRRSLHASSQRRDASATFSLSCPTN